MAHLLLVEDNQHMQRIYSEKFRREGFKVTTAESGERGLELAVQEKPDVILLDIMLPKINGFEVLQQLRATPETIQTPVFMLSNRAWPDDVQSALTLGANQFYSKGSSSLQDIVKQIRNDCGLKKIALITRHTDSGQAVIAAMEHPQILCSVLTVLAEAVTAAERGCPDMIIIDGRPPMPNPFAMVQQIKTTPATANVPLLVVTANDQVIQRTDACVNMEEIQTELRPAVLKLLGLQKPAAHTSSGNVVPFRRSFTAATS